MRNLPRRGRVAPVAKTRWRSRSWQLRAPRRWQRLSLRLLPAPIVFAAVVVIGALSGGVPDLNLPIDPAMSSSPAAADESITGRASVIDGDTIEIHGERIRILDIDAPESRQTCTAQDGSRWRCGQKASLALSDWIGGQTVTCTTTGKERYGRWLARCITAGEDIGQWMVMNGWAVPYRDCKCEVIRNAAVEAEAAQSGIWAGTFQMPWEWRKAN